MTSASDSGTQSGPVGNKPFRLHRQAMAGQVADEIRRRILMGEIAEGTQLMQEQLATEFGISKVPVREALYQLEAEGFVSQQFHRGAVVTGLSPSQIMELFELRTEIESWLLTLGMAVATDDAVKRAKGFADKFEATEDPVVTWDLNWRFHASLYEPAQKPYVLEHLQKLHSQTARYVRLQYSIALNKQKIVDEHQELLDHYARKDRNTVALLRKHILEAATLLTNRLMELKAQGA